jgi:NTE family protein
VTSLRFWRRLRSERGAPEHNGRWADVAPDVRLFQDVPLDELSRVLEGFDRRTYEPDRVVVAEGDTLHELYIVLAGTAAVVVVGPDGREHEVGRVAPGGTVGEMALLTGEPAAATVRSTAPLDVLVLTEDEFAELGQRFPQVYRNLGTLLAERLAHTNRLVAKRSPGRLVVLANDGAPPLLGCALACSLAWHTRERTLFLGLRSDPGPELRALAKAARDRTGVEARRGVAILEVEAPRGRYAPEALYETLVGLFDRFQNIVLELDAGTEPALQTATNVRLEPGDARGPSADGVLAVRGWSTGTTLRPHHDRVVCVPELGDDDVRAMQNGVLPTSTAAGLALGWAARDLAGLKVGVALGAGSIRGYAHIGVLEALMRNGIPIDAVAGTSIGSAVAGLHALGQTPSEIADTLDEFGPNLFKLTLPVRSLLSNRGMRRYMQTVAPGVRIEDLDVPLAIVAADIRQQREVVFRRGLLWQAVLTSVSIPGIYPASPIGGGILVDGGVLNPVPASVAAQMGAGVVIAVKLGSRGLEPEFDLEAAPARGTPPTTTSVLFRAIEIMQSRIDGDPADATVVNVAPMSDLMGPKLRRFHEGRRYIGDGAAAVEEALPRLAAVLPWLSGGGASPGS